MWVWRPGVRQDDQYEQEAVGRRRDDEEIRGHHLAHVIPQERAPGLRRWRPPPNHVLGDTGLTDLYAELQQFAVEVKCAPKRVRFRHRADQHPNFTKHARPTGSSGPFDESVSIT
jgi:hypothetical protein